MAVRDEDFGSGLTLVEGDDGIWSSPEAAPACAPRDWRSECEREHARAERERARADAAEARCEELRWAEVESRARAGSLKWQLDRSRSKLKAAVEETQEVRRTAKDALSLQAEVTRLEKLLSEASIEPAKHRPTSPADKARRRLRATLEQAENQKATIKSLRAERGELRKEVTRLNRELARLGKRLAREEQASERHKETIRRQYDEDIQHRAALRRLRDQSDRVRSLPEEVFWLRIALDGAKAGREALKARLVKLRAVGATLSKLPSDEAAHLRVALRKSRRQKTTINVLSKENARLRRAVKGSRTRREASDALLAKLRATGKSLSKSLRGADAELRRALRRSRRQKATIRSLSRENARLRKRAKASRNRIETLEVQLARLRATGAVLSRALFGRKSEKQETPRSGRPRGQQRGAPGHGRTQRPGLEERTEELKPPEEARVCSCCGKAYVANGVDESTLVEIEVKAYKRVIRRPRWRRACGCASSPIEVSAPPAPRLFPRTLYGTSFRARFLFEHCACFRPLHRVAAWMSGQGLPISPGTLANSLKRFVPLFEPVADAILAHQNEAALRHADETGWRVQALRGEDRSSRAWLWTSVSSDAVSFHIDASRSAEAALELFGEGLLDTVIVCDRYSAYKRLARLREGLVTLAFCWSHQRRDFIECAAGQVSLTQWCQGWVEQIAVLYRLNEARLEHYDPGLERQTPAFDAAQGRLKEALDGLFAEAELELAGLPDQAREGKALRSLVNHREGLCVFVDRPQVPLDNNLAERVLRGPVIGRRLSFGSDSENGARFTAVMYSVVGTLALNGIDVLRWLEAWLEACAKNAGRPPDDLSPWLPWSMSEERRRAFMAAA